MSRLGLVHDVDVVKHCVERLDPGHWHVCFRRQLDGRSQESLDFHRATGLEVLEHGTRGLGRGHLLNRLLSEVIGKCASLNRSKLDKLVDHTGYQLAHAGLLEKLGEVGSFKDHARGVECDRAGYCVSTTNSLEGNV